ncbi:hypothetical protein NCER_102185 [Vairimorpha ceranae BRL01]|uniref:Uncharacterized protein n=2 Tax=Vairimorpha ceranae TaxID=40302 RepID=C4VBK7_VAIC1|nr:hypothetical protein AAJ76_3000011883 [Vairimorpha ceranae]EEQ81394.1 hypothetical protein NCER_102185 [Vairimorpha ceranae BRL01]KKO75144.1 hypothetical protein AAJ76_3000011883 [Vairimorpha ceranae]
MFFILGAIILTPVVIYTITRFNRTGVDNETIDIFKRHTKVNVDDINGLMLLLDVLLKNIKIFNNLLSSKEINNLNSFIKTIKKVLQNNYKDDKEYQSRFLVYYFSKIGALYSSRFPEIKRWCIEITKSNPSFAKEFNKVASNNTTNLELCIVSLLIAFDEKNKNI